MREDQPPMTAPEPVNAEKMSNEGKEIQKPQPSRNPAAEVMEANRMVQEERRNADRRVQAEKERARQEIDRARADGERRLAELQAERKVMLRTISQLNTENESLEREILLLKAKLEAVEWVRQGFAPAPPPAVAATPSGDMTIAGVPVLPMPADGRLPDAPGTIFKMTAVPDGRPGSRPGRPAP